MKRADGLIRIFSSALLLAQEMVLEQMRHQTQEADLEPKPDAQVSFSGLPLVSPEHVHHRIPPLDAQRKLIAVSGTVVRIGSPRLIERCGRYECTRCKCEVELEADMTQYGQIPKPPFCTAVIDGQECRNSKFNKVLSFRAPCEDYQEIKIQESTSNLEIGAVPRSLIVILRRDLIDKAKAGDNVQITGVLRSRWKPLKSGTKAELEMFLDANGVSANSQDISHRLEVSIDFMAHISNFWDQHQDAPLTGRSHVVNSFAPAIHGMFLPKLALLLVLVGGCSGDEDDSNAGGSVEVGTGSRRHRKEGHILFVGDPGTAKSQLIMCAAKLATRAVLTTGSGSTNAGLTVTAVKEGGDWTLEAGALVLADRGVCCIDEFSQLRAADRTAIHEAMEQQTLSVAKAGLVCKLNTRCSVIAACNSKGRFEEGESISSNTALASPLLSRFDLILVLLDRRSPEWDAELANSILQAACRSSNARDAMQVDSNPSNETWDFDLLKAYIAHCKKQGQPKMSNAARVLISKYYQAQRGGLQRDAARTTVRLLESLIRLSQAHAKLLWQTEVLAHDAITAIMLMESSLQTQALLGFRPDLYEGAPTAPEEQYRVLSAQIMARLQINPAVFESESQRLVEESAELDEILCSWAPTQR